MSNSNKRIRLNKVLRELNISLDKAVEYLATKGVEIEARPTTKISYEEYEILMDGFQTHRSKKAASKEVGEEIRKEKEDLRLAAEAKAEKLRFEEEAKYQAVKAKDEKFKLKSVDKKVNLNDFLEGYDVSPDEAIQCLKDIGYNVVIEENIKISVSELTWLVNEFKNKKIKENSDFGIKTEYKKLSGPNIKRKTIDLKQFVKKSKPEVIKNTASQSNLNKRRVIRKSDNSKSEEFLLKTKDQIEKEFKNHWRVKNFNFIGKFKIGANGKTSSFSDVRDEEGDLLYYPHIEGTKIKGGVIRVFSPINLKLDENEYYHFEAIINPIESKVLDTPFIANRQKFKKAGKLITERLIKEELVKEIYRETAPNERVARNQANAIKKVTEDAYEEDERFIFELIQNADDTGSEDNLINLSFNFKFGHIIVNHNGIPFSDQDVTSITSIGYSSPDKSKNIKKTGYKGIGFKAVFIVSDKVVIASGGYTFEFSKYHHFHKNTKWEIENIPWEIQPIWMQKYRLPLWASNYMPLTNESTSFLLELKNNREITPKKVEIDANKIFNNPRFSLFLRNTAKIKLEGRNGNVSIEKHFNPEDSTIKLLLNNKIDSTWITWRNTKVIIPVEVKDSIQDDSTTPKKLKEAHSITLSFAAKVDDEKVIDLESHEKVLFTYLPTSVKDYGFPYLVNADFLTILNRQSIKTKKAWNLFLFQQIGYNQFLWAIDLWKSNSPLKFSLLKLIQAPFEDDSIPTYDAFDEGFEKGISELAFIPSNSLVLEKMEDIIIDETGISKILGEELFLELFEYKKKLIHPKMKNLKWLKNQMDERKEGIIFNWDILLDEVGNLKNWLKNTNNDIAFLNFISKNKKVEEFDASEIVLDQKGNLKCFDELYEHIPENDENLLSFLKFSILDSTVREGLEETNLLPFLTYTPENFIIEHILGNKNTVDKKIEDFQNSENYYNYLAINESGITDNTVDELKWFHFFDNHKEVQTSIDDSNIYFENDKINKLINSCLPKEQILRLPKEYLLHPNSNNLWKRFGAKTLNESNIADFIQNEICDKVSDINEKLNELFNDEDENLCEFAINELIRFLELHQKHLTADSLEKLKSLELFLTQKNLESCVNEMNIYFEKESILQLLKSKCLPPEQIWLLPNNYLKSEMSKTFWKGLGVKSIEESNVVKFIQDEICTKVDDINTHWNSLYQTDIQMYKVASIRLYKFLSKHQNLLTSNDYDQIRKLEFFKSHQNVEDCLSNCTFYFKEESILKLIDNKCFPQGHLSIIPQEYLEEEMDKVFWEMLGVTEVDETTVTKFISLEITDAINSINKHLESLLEGDDTEYLNAVKSLLYFFKENEQNISEAESKLIVKELAKILILTSEDELKEIKDCYVSSEYTEKSDIEELLNSFPDVELSFISNKFLLESKLTNKDWEKLFVKLGAKNDHLKFVKNSLIPHFQDISEDTIVAATRLLFENRKYLEEEIQNFESFPILTKDRDIIKSTEVTIGSHYFQDSQTKSLIAQFNLHNEISSNYGSDKLDKWTNFFKSLKVPTKTEDELIVEVIKIMLKSQDTYELETIHNKIFTLLWQLHHSGLLLDSHYALLKEWKLKSYSNKSSEIRFEPAQSILFSNAYNPKIRFEDYEIEDEINILSDFYLNDVENQNSIFNFLKKLGVRGAFVYNRIDEMYRQNMPAKYVEWMDEKYINISSEAFTNGDSHKVLSWVEVPFINLIVNPAINAVFWEQVQEKKSFKNVIFDTVSYKKRRFTKNIDSEPLWFVKNNKTVLNLKGELCQPDELYNFSLKDEINDASLVTSIDFESIESEKFNSLANALEIKTSLDFRACIKILKRKESHNWLSKRHIISKIDEFIHEGLTNEEEDLLEKFNTSGFLLSQTLDWVPIDKLFVVDPSFKLGITKSPNLIHQDFIGLVDHFKVNKLKEDDFEFDPLNKVKDNNLMSLLLQRAKYLAFLQDEENWNDKNEELLEDVKKLSFYKCKKISWSYNESDPVISNSDFDFYYSDSTDEFFFIGQWDRIQAAEMYPILYKRLKLKEPVNEKVFKEILLAENTYELLNIFVDNNFVLPLELDPNGITLPKEDLDEESYVNDDQSKIEGAKVENDHSTSGNSADENSDEPTSQNNKEDKKTKRDTSSKNDDNQQENNSYKDNSEFEYNNATRKIEYSAEEEESIKQLFGSEISGADKFNENMAAHIKGLHHLKNLEYDISIAETDFKDYLPKKFLNNVVKDGVEYKVMCRSAKGGVLYFGAHAWIQLANENTILYILLGNDPSKCKLIFNQEDLNSQTADYWLARREIDDQVSHLTNLAEAENEQGKLQFLFGVGQSKFSGIFQKWDKNTDANQSGTNLGNEDEI